MSDIKILTRCPHCETTFRIYEHQLERRNGQVRCGACGNVFDAYIDMETRVDPLLVPPPLSSPPSPLPNLTPAPASGPIVTAPMVTAPIVAIAAAASHTDTLSPTQNLTTSPADVDMDFTSNGRSADPFPKTDPLGDGYDFGPRALDLAAARRQSLLAALLAVVLVAQSILWFRSEIAGYSPSTRPLLSGLCAALGCKVHLPRNADRIAIETSELQSERPGFLTLAGTLRNNANYAQAYPSLELTLTDARDQPIVRRVLVPRDYLAPTLIAEEGVAAGAEIAIRAVIDASKISASGYRMFIFYPPVYPAGT